MAGTARMLLFAATAGHAGVPDSRLIAPAARDGLRGHGAVCGRGSPGVQHWLPVTAHRLPLPSAPWPVPAAGNRRSKSARAARIADKTGATRCSTSSRSCWRPCSLRALAWLTFAVRAKLAADRDDARSNRKFLPTQRIQLYGSLFAQVDTTVALMTDYFPTGDKAGTPYSKLPSPNPEQYNEIDEADSRLNTLYGRVLVLSSVDFTRKAPILLAQTGSSTTTYGSSES